MLTDLVGLSESVLLRRRELTLPGDLPGDAKLPAALWPCQCGTGPWCRSKGLLGTGWPAVLSLMASVVSLVGSSAE